MANAEEQLSDDEIFFGQLSLKEFKKHILWDKQVSKKLTTGQSHKVDKQETSLKLIETHSQPNLISGRDRLSLSPRKSCERHNRSVDDSFINIEKMVENLCVSQEEKSGEFNNTLEVIEYILNNGPIYDTNLKDDNKAFIDENASNTHNNENKSVIDITSQHQVAVSQPCHYVTPTKIHKDIVKTETPIFKTPTQPAVLQRKKITTLKKTPSRTISYQHIASPVASYIKRSPQVPLLKEVHPKKPLPNLSCIPKFVKSSTNKLYNKENVNLPTIAYKSAKKTKVIDLADEDKLPQCQWARKITSTLPRPVVLKHEHREMHAKRTLLSQQEDSFSDLPCQQADVSVCTQKTAFEIKK